MTEPIKEQGRSFDSTTARAFPAQQGAQAVHKWHAIRKGPKTGREILVITAISASVDSQKEIDNDIDEIANKASPKMHS